MSGPEPDTPALPSRNNSTPSGENLITWCPMPSRPPASVTHRLPSGSSPEPCGKMNMPLPNAFRSLPLGSNLRIGGSGRPAQEFAAQRWMTKIEPSAAASMEVTAAHFMPAGSSPQSRVVRYGWGKSLRAGLDVCASAEVMQAEAARARMKVDRVMGLSRDVSLSGLSIALAGTVG